MWNYISASPQLRCKYEKDAKTVKNFLKVVGNHYGISENFETLLEKFPRDITTYITYNDYFFTFIDRVPCTLSFLSNVFCKVRRKTQKNALQYLG